jgi:hypothetical protein
MDPRPQDIAETSLLLRRHWIALAGVGVAALMGGGFAKVLSPEELNPAPMASQLFSGPPVAAPAEDMRLSYNGRMPDYVIGTDLTRPPRDYSPEPFSEDIQQIADTSFDADRYQRPQYETVADYVNHHARQAARSGPDAPFNREAYSVYHSTTDDAFSALPAMAPG